MATTEAPEWRETVDTLLGGERHGFSGDEHDMRTQFNGLQKLFKSLEPTDLDGKVDVKEQKFPASDGVEIRVLVFLPKTPGLRKLGVHYHGGGWVMGNPEGESYVCKSLAVGLSAVIVSVDYRLAPENKYPVPMNDAYEAAIWAQDHAADWQADSSNIFLSGNSAGSNLAAAVSIRNRDEGNMTIKATLLTVPCVLHPRDMLDQFSQHLTSYERNKDAPVLTAKVMTSFWNKCPRHSRKSKCSRLTLVVAHLYNPPPHPYASPLLLKNFKDLPPAFFVLSGLDPLHDEGALYAKLLEQDGVPTKTVDFEGFPHSFFLFLNMATSQKAIENMVDGVKWAFEQKCT